MTAVIGDSLNALPTELRRVASHLQWESGFTQPTAKNRYASAWAFNICSKTLVDRPSGVKPTYYLLSLAMAWETSLQGLRGYSNNYNYLTYNANSLRVVEWLPNQPPPIILRIFWRMPRITKCIFHLCHRHQTARINSSVTRDLCLIIDPTHGV